MNYTAASCDVSIRFYNFIFSEASFGELNRRRLKIFHADLKVNKFERLCNVK